MSNSTINEEEVKKFSDIADQWWDPKGKFKPLHKFNPIRILFIKEKIAQYFSLDKDRDKPLEKLKIADIGCGGGLISEPLAQLGAKMTGIDASAKNIEVAKIHAEKSGLEINYQNISAEDLSQKKEKFDVVLALEVVEHVENIQLFIDATANCLKKDGILFIATLNRTPISYIKSIIGAEYLLRWLPIGTHDFQKFLKPHEVNEMAEKSGLKLLEEKGFDYNLIQDSWKITTNLDVNYIMIFKKK